ncbi:MAG: lipopolysaccharide biosynthesis protein [Bacteroidales bacterium]|jgi:PST family polysaccharide transporter|nr:lipopolysaccharide biosynthesis protein [Bacteroidales bacterium]
MTSTKKQLISGVTYTAVSKYSGIFISLIVAAILSRLIVPEDFGIVAIAMVFITFFNTFSNLGIAPAIVQNKELEEKDLSEIFCFTIWIALILSVIFFFLSGLIASYYESPHLLSICRILSIQLFFATINIVPNSLFLKNKRFKFIATRNLIIQLIAGIIAIIAAFSGAGLYALLIAPVLTAVARFIIGIYVYPQKIEWTFGINAVRKIFAYSLYQFLFEMINYFSRNLDKLMIGKYLGMTPLGYYEKSYRLMMLPLQNITHVITPVLHPVLSDLQKNMSQISASYIKIVRFLAFIGFPLSVFLFFTAKEITLLIFGMQWTASVPVFQILALSVGIQMILSTSGSIFQAANDTKMLFVSGIISTLLTVTGLCVGLFIFKTLIAVAWGICISFVLNFVLCYVIMYRITLKVDMLSFWKQFISPLVISIISLIIMFFLNQLVRDYSLWMSLIIKSIAFFSIVLFYMQLTGEYNIKGKIKQIIQRK